MMLFDIHLPSLQLHVVDSAPRSGREPASLAASTKLALGDLRIKKKLRVFLEARQQRKAQGAQIEVTRSLAERLAAHLALQPLPLPTTLKETHSLSLTSSKYKFK